MMSSDSEDLFSSNPDVEPDYVPDNQSGTDSDREWDGPFTLRCAKLFSFVDMIPETENEDNMIPETESEV